MAEANQVVFAESGVDYITATGLGGKQTQLMAEFGIRMLRESRELGNNHKPWGMSGFSGFSCGPIAVGQRQGEFIIRASSQWAWRYWEDIYGLADNISRLDIQATVADGREPFKRIKMHHREGCKWSSQRDNHASVALLTNNHGGITLTINRRVSTRYGRVYDKAAESGLEHYRGCVRYEVELKGQPAKSMAHSLSRSSNADATAGVQALRFFHERGLQVREYFPSFAKNPTSPQEFLMRDPGQRPLPITDQQRQLNWLSKSVRATVQKLIASGRLTDVQEALGISGTDQAFAELAHVGQSPNEEV